MSRQKDSPIFLLGPKQSTEKSEVWHIYFLIYCSLTTTKELFFVSEPDLHVSRTGLWTTATQPYTIFTKGTDHQPAIDTLCQLSHEQISALRFSEWTRFHLDGGRRWTFRKSILDNAVKICTEFHAHPANCSKDISDATDLPTFDIFAIETLPHGIQQTKKGWVRCFAPESMCFPVWVYTLGTKPVLQQVIFYHPQENIFVVYDEALAGRISNAIGSSAVISQKEMFALRSFNLDGKLIFFWMISIQEVLGQDTLFSKWLGSSYGKQHHEEWRAFQVSGLELVPIKLKNEEKEEI
ncbi:hypothetical protein B0T10DRAFT_467145 [Thelonectria olida]|uniref:Uncharacterized protein n=1 Tax=Thelonectria olida TaxID=1576542 RepID=A0A9P8VQ81_9HYPO|nr:hypothetical protein B0T10DRAFT_467145 [Thelonectria olida]